MPERGRLLLGVTADVSLSLMRGLPQHLSALGWDVHVVCSPGPLLTELAADPTITTHAVRMTREPSPIADLRSLISWLRLLRRIRPEITCLGTPKVGLLGGLAAWLTRVPLRVHHLRGLRLETTTGLRRRVFTVLERVSLRSAHDVIAVSPSLRRRAVELRLINEARIHVLGSGSSNGVVIPAELPTEADRAALRAELGLDSAVPVVGFVGRLNPDKGLHVLARARRILHDRGVDHQMLVVGGIDLQPTPEIIAELRAAGRPAVETGHVPDARRYYAGIDILCLPTLREGFPNVVLEAAAVGVPAVTTDATGAIDSVVDGVTGRIATAGDALSLADRLQDLISATPTARTQLGAAARERALTEFSREHVWELLDAHLVKAATRQRSGRRG